MLRAIHLISHSQKELGARTCENCTLGYPGCTQGRLVMITRSVTISLRSCSQTRWRRLGRQFQFSCDDQCKCSCRHSSYGCWNSRLGWFLVAPIRKKIRAVVQMQKSLCLLQNRVVCVGGVHAPNVVPEQTGAGAPCARQNHLIPRLPLFV